MLKVPEVYRFETAHFSECWGPDKRDDSLLNER